MDLEQISDVFGINTIFADMKVINPEKARCYIATSFSELDMGVKNLTMFRSVISPGHAASLIDDFKDNGDFPKALCWKNQNLCSWLEEVLSNRLDCSPRESPMKVEGGDLVIFFNPEYFYFEVLSFLELECNPELERIRRCILSQEKLKELYGDLSESAKVRVQSGNYME